MTGERQSDDWQMAREDAIGAPYSVSSEMHAWVVERRWIVTTSSAVAAVDSAKPGEHMMVRVRPARPEDYIVGKGTEGMGGCG